MGRTKTRVEGQPSSSTQANEFWGVVCFVGAGLMLAGFSLDKHGLMPQATHGLFELLGFGSWYLVLTLILWGVKKFQQKPLMPTGRHVAGWMILFPAFAGFITGVWMLSGQPGAPGGQEVVPGGMVGRYTWNSLARILGSYSATIFLGGLVMALFAGFSDISLASVARRLARASVWTVRMGTQALLIPSRKIGRLVWVGVSSLHGLVFVIIKDMVHVSLRFIEVLQEMGHEPTPSLAGNAGGSLHGRLLEPGSPSGLPEGVDPSPVPVKRSHDGVPMGAPAPAPPVQAQDRVKRVVEAPLPGEPAPAAAPVTSIKAAAAPAPAAPAIPVTSPAPVAPPVQTAAPRPAAPVVQAAPQPAYAVTAVPATAPAPAPVIPPLPGKLVLSPISDDEDEDVPGVMDPDWSPHPDLADEEDDEPEVAMIKVEARSEYPPYQLPTADLLKPIPGPTPGQETVDELRMKAAWIVETLAQFKIQSEVTNIVQGPSVTRFELKPQAGIKLSTIAGLSNNLSMALATKSIRIEAPIPGMSVVGIEVPNRKMSPVTFRSIISHPVYRNNKSLLKFAVGENIAGQPVVGDLARMPHLLIAGYTGSGKSVCINTILASILYNATPDEVRLILIDPKMVELSTYSGIPHLITDVVTDSQDAPPALKWGVMEMERRYRYLSSFRMRNIDSFNEALIQGKLEAPAKSVPMPDRPMPYIVIVIDELADLMIVAKREIEESIVRLTQMARAVGIHLVVATQRPSVNVITGVIKANLPSRIAFSVASKVDSKVILDITGAEKLLGRGDMLYVPVGEQRPNRIQGAFIDDEEVKRLVDELKRYGEPEYTDIVGEVVEKTRKGTTEDFQDDMYNDCLRLACEKGEASTSMFQTHLKIGYNRSARIVEEMEGRGIISGQETGKRRKLLINPSEISRHFIS